MLQHPCDALLDAPTRGVDAQRGVFGLLEGSRDAREVADLTPSGLGVEPLYVATLALPEGCGDVYFAEVFGSGDLPGQTAQFARRAHEAGQNDDARIDEEPAYLGHASDVLASVFLREPEAGIDAAADVVAVEDTAKNAAGR